MSGTLWPLSYLRTPSGTRLAFYSGGVALPELTSSL